MKIVWSEQARQEWADHYRYYLARNPEAARRLRKAVMDGVKRLRDYPRIGRPGRVAESRELVISGSPFLIVYDVSAARVEILHVYHGRQDWQGESEGGNQ